MREAVLVSSVRTPVGRAYKGTLRATRPDELAAIAIKGALARVPQLDLKEIEDVIFGCAMPEAEQGMNVARIAALRAVHVYQSRHSERKLMGLSDAILPQLPPFPESIREQGLVGRCLIRVNAPVRRPTR